MKKRPLGAQGGWSKAVELRKYGVTLQWAGNPEELLERLRSQAEVAGEMMFVGRLQDAGYTDEEVDAALERRAGRLVHVDGSQVPLDGDDEAGAARARGPGLDPARAVDD